MISIDFSFISTVKMTDRPIASACSLGLSRTELIASGLSGVSAVKPAGLSGLLTRERPVMVRDERPTEALEAGVAAAGNAYAFAATGAETKQQTQHHLMWAFRGLEPWSDPA
ncbi:hypothetical protein ACFXKG_35110 [Streptomyces sp. NPDC059255]|uniref:hypothetical protein n=1 Tax=Streptomyces sp. NPDC059255 TaxID=3346793 RepID=UPI0036910DA4